MMPLEAPNKLNLPWMLSCSVDDWIEFTVKQQTIEKTENDKGWSCYKAEMKDIGVPRVEDDDYEIPFWAMEAFFDAYNLADKDKGWQTYKFKRSQKGDKNSASFRVE